MTTKARFIAGAATAAIAAGLATGCATAPRHTASIVPAAVASASAANRAAVAAMNRCTASGGEWSQYGSGTCIAATTAAPAATAPATTAPATHAPVTTPAAPAITVAEQQAIDAAQGYLSLGSGFSAASLQNQLTSGYGNGFSQADAAYAISYLHPDWYTQAVDAAQGYMQLGGFSHDSLLNQLTSNYGNGFTYRQAEYAVTRVGL